MGVLLLVSFAAVVGVKYYTSMGMRALERRLRGVQQDLDTIKKQRKDKEAEQQGAVGEEDSYEQRIRNMKEIISDLEYRLTTSTVEEPEVY